MNEINNLRYFLKTMKETLPFKDEDDFKRKIKVHKLVYLSKFFGWNNEYHFNFHENGPYSCELSKDYHNIHSPNQSPSMDLGMDLKKFESFIKNRSNDFLEASSTILYFSSKQKLKFPDKTNIVEVLSYLKPHIHSEIVESSYDTIKEFDLFNYNPDNHHNINKSIVLDKLDGLINIFKNFEVCSNQTMILGSLDYFRLALKREHLKDSKNELINVIYDYGELIENYYFTNYTLKDNFPYADLSKIDERFDLLQDYISNLEILPRLYDEDVDLNIFIKGIV